MDGVTPISEQDVIPSMEEEEQIDDAPAMSSKRKQAVPRRAKKAPQGTKTLVSHGNRTVVADAKTKKKHRFRPGTVALREIRNMQRGTELLIPRRPMRFLIRELAGEQRPNIRLTKEAVESLHVAAETFITELLSRGMTMAVFAGRVSLELKDLRMAVEQSGITLSKEYLEMVRRIQKIN